jgi:hypothetical protein
MKTSIGKTQAQGLSRMMNKAMLAAAALMIAGCASSERMSRISPLAAQQPASASDGKSPQEHTTSLADDRVNVFPLYYGAAGVHAVLWPLVDWDSRGFAVRPLYNREGENASVLFPLSGWDSRGGWALNSVWDHDHGFLFLPIAGKWNGMTFVGPGFSDGDAHYGFLPVFGRYGDTFQCLNVFVTSHEGRQSTVAASPFYYDSEDFLWVSELYAWSRHKDGAQSRRSLFGALYHGYESADGNASSLWVFPGLYSENDATSHLTVTPFYSSGSDTKGERFNIHPLWWSSKTATESSRTLIPFWFNRVSGGDSSTITPLWSYGNERTESWMNIHPLWWSSETPESASERLFPFYSHHRDAAGESTFALPWSSGNRNGTSWNHVYPLWFSNTDKNETTRALIPFYIASESKQSSTAFTPLWSAGHDGKESWMNIHPLWWSWESDKAFSQALVPLYYRHGSESGDSAYSLLYCAGNEGSHSWFHIPPLWWSSQDGADASRLLLPLYYGYETATSSGDISPLWSAGHDTKGSYLNIHPLWWSSKTEDESSRLLLPFWYSSHDKTGYATFTPLCSEGSGEGRSWFNIHPFWFSSTQGDTLSTTTVFPLFHRRTGASGTTVFSPLCTYATDKTGEAELVNVLGILYHWSDDGASRYTHTLWPLFGTNREAIAGNETIVTPTLIALDSSQHYTGFRFTPIVSVQNSDKDHEMPRWCPHLFDFRYGKERSSWWATPLAVSETMKDGSDMRITPFVSRSDGVTEPGWRYYLHLYTRATGPGLSTWSVTPLVGGETHGDKSTSYALPFYRSESVAGESRAFRILPFYAKAEQTGYADMFSVWSHATDPAREERRLFGALWRRTDERPATPAPATDAKSPASRLVSRTTVVTPLTESRDTTRVVRKADDATERTVAGEAFAVNPLWIPLYREESEGDSGEWSFLFGVAYGEHAPGRSRTSVLRYLYDREESPDGVRVNCFPFVQNDTLKTREKFSFLWRVFDRETDLKTGETKGHILFIPY